MPLQQLDPPYATLARLGAGRPALGAVVVADLSEGIPALAEALAASREVPWCPLVSCLDDRRIPGAVLSTFESIPGTWTTLYPGDFAYLPPAGRAVAAVRRRPVPLATTIAQWVAGRLRLPESASVLAACFGEAGDALRPPRTLTRRVQALGPLEVRDWRGLARLAQLLARRSGRSPTTLECAAYESGVDPRTLRRWLRLATDAPWPEVATWVGWEWVLESTLGRFGYAGWWEVRQMRRVNGGLSTIGPRV